MNLILLRHGESQWNLENRFTGWKDVKLTETGISEACFAAQQIKKNNLTIDTLYTSELKRAIHTSKIVAGKIGFNKKKIINDWRLNERHYGALQGLNKSETAKKYGEDQVKIWRRSYDVCPPKLSLNDKRHPRFNKKFKEIKPLPSGESLKNVVERLRPFLDQFFTQFSNEKNTHLIVGHSNSLRAIIKQLDNLSDIEIVDINVPTGVPLLYRLDSKLSILEKKYLLNKEELNSKQQKIIDQGKAN
tara:strand:+ start:265 stop:1002 length:738 start_codon:yes stop_codon:yes gene_type:complete